MKKKIVKVTTVFIRDETKNIKRKKKQLSEKKLNSTNECRLRNQPLNVKKKEEEK